MRITQKACIEAIAAAGGLLGPAAQSLGITRRILVKRIEKSKVLQEHLADVKENVLDAVEGMVLKAAVNGKDIATAR